VVRAFVIALAISLVGLAVNFTPGVQNAEVASWLYAAAGITLLIGLVVAPIEWIGRRKTVKPATRRAEATSASGPAASTSADHSPITQHLGSDDHARQVERQAVGELLVSLYEEGKQLEVRIVRDRSSVEQWSQWRGRLVGVGERPNS
jgi:hypothetical protein